MPVDLTIPQSGESITEVQIGQWRKKVGDYVSADEILVEIETDKAAMDLPAPVAGLITEILKHDGDDAEVGDVIARIDSDASQPEGAAPAASAEPPAAAPPAAPAPAGDTRVMPAAARLLAEHGLTPDAITATGPGGRLLKEDVERVIESRDSPAQAPAPTPAILPDVAGPTTAREQEVVRMSPMRKKIARNLVEAQQNAALLTTFNEADMSAVMALRKQYQDAFVKKYDIKLGFMSFFVKACVEALKEVPQVNAQMRDESVVYHNYYDIGIAVGGGRGLVVPVIRNAELLSFSEVEKTIADFGRRAQANKIELDELKGGTFTISNGGIYGSMLSTPIINPPQSGILGMHNIIQRPVVVDGQIVARPMMYLALSYDHRIVDGREAVTFLRKVKDIIEDPIRILVEV